jgi:hypothetical protein
VAVSTVAVPAYAQRAVTTRIRDVCDWFRMSTSHAAWDVDAVHRMHAAYSVKNLGTALEDVAETPNQRSTGFRGPEVGSHKPRRRADSQTFVSPAPPAFFHLVHESLRLMGAGSLGRLRSIATLTHVGVATDVLPGVDGGHRRRDHDHEAKDAKEWVDRNTCDEEAEAGKKPHTGKCRATPMDSPYAGPA